MDFVVFCILPIVELIILENLMVSRIKSRSMRILIGFVIYILLILIVSMLTPSF